MPLREDILTPITGDNPSGENLRYAPVYDKIKEARRQDDDAPQGDWQTARKVADWKTVLKLGGEALATKSKDLQLAAWLTEALLNTEGFSGLNSGLTLIRNLVENFWDTLYPELEDGEAEYRAAPLDWVGGSYLTLPVRNLPLTKAGYGLLKFQEAKIVGREEEANADYEKQAKYQEAIAEGKLSMDEWDKAFNATSKAFYVQLLADIEACLTTLEEIQPLFEEKFGEFVPSFSKLKGSVEEVQRLANQLLDKKRETEPDEDAPAAEPDDIEETVQESAPAAISAGGGTAAKPKKISRSVTSIEPSDREDAIARVAAAAAFWRKEDPYSPAPYLMLRGMRWGEVRAAGSLDAAIFEAPSSETRQALKRLWNEGSYEELLNLAEETMASPCGRAWLDLQRYVVKTVEYQGYYQVGEAIKAELKSLLRDFPDLKEATLLDDTPTANKETQDWLNEFAAPPVESASETPAAPAADYWSTPAPEASPETAVAEDSGPDSFALARDAARAGRTSEALEILMAEVARQNSGRGRFQRQMQLAQVCLAVGQEAIAHSILEALAKTIDKHDLESWEAPDMVAHALSLLYGCMSRNGTDPESRQQVYSRICRLDPVQALNAGK